eukprot:6182752-Pleurochrysis_carterae.AAC.1
MSSSTDEVDNHTLVLTDWLSALGHDTSSIRYLPLDLIGTLQIRITLHSKAVLAVKEGGKELKNAYTAGTEGAYALCDFSLSNMALTYDAVSFPESYMQALRSRLASGAYLPWVYRTYVDSNSSPTSANSH